MILSLKALEMKEPPDGRLGAHFGGGRRALLNDDDRGGKAGDHEAHSIRFSGNRQRELCAKAVCKRWTVEKLLGILKKVCG
jgi:hypothetical protein